MRLLVHFTMETQGEMQNGTATKVPEVQFGANNQPKLLNTCNREPKIQLKHGRNHASTDTHICHCRVGRRRARYGAHFLCALRCLFSLAADAEHGGKAVAE